MAMQVYISHSGARIFAQPDSLQSIDTLRTWIAGVASIPPTRQILMTRRGKNVKQQHLSSEEEVFVYDKQYLSSDEEVPTAPVRTPHTLLKQTEPPKSVTNENSLPAYQELFMRRRTWALSAAEDVRIGVDHVREYMDEADVIARSTAVALENLRTHVGTLQARFETTQKWAQDMLQEHQAALDDWQGSVNVLKELPIREDLARLLNGGEHLTPNKSDATLFDLIHTDELEDAAVRLAETSGRVRGRLKELFQAMQDLDEENTTAQKHGEGDLPETVDLDGLLEECETLAKRVGGDYEEILRLQQNSKSIAFASRRSAVHVQELLPTLQNLLTETNDALKSSASVRDELSRNCVLALKDISVIESGLGALQAQVLELDNESRGGEDLDAINQVFHLPIAYGSVLVEAVRRSEWRAQMENEMTSLRDEVVPIKEAEEKRRKRWFKSMSQFLQEALASRDPGVDIQFVMTRDDWPEAGRDEIYTYIDDLKALGIDDAVQEMANWLKELEEPSQRRKQTPKAFKNGSVSDLGQSSVFRANGDEFKTLQDDKLRLEEKLRAADSRVRKLEDLLHRQSQTTGPAHGSFGPALESHSHSPSPNPLPPSRPNELLSRRSSASSRRLSNQTPEDKAYVQRIVSLEAEVARLQRDAHAERRASTENRDKMQEAESVKHDLMANFEAQRQEFDDERQILDDEVHRLKIRLEETEDELDRLIGSRDHQRSTSEQTMANLQSELDQLRRTSTMELSKARKDARSMSEEWHGQMETLRRRMQEVVSEKSAVEEDKAALAAQVRDHQQGLQEQISLLTVAHSHLSPDGSAPDDPRRLAAAISVLSEGLAIHARGTEEALQRAELDNMALQEQTVQLESKIKSMEVHVAADEATVRSLRKDLSHDRAALATVRAEFEQEHAQVEHLRSKLTAGESGVEELRQRLTAAEHQVVELSERVAVANAGLQSLQLEHALVQDQLDKRDADIRALTAHLEARGSRAKELSQRLFQYNEKIMRMLEQLGYSVTRQDDSLIIQRASKVNASTLLPSASIIEASTLMKRTASGSSPPQYQPDPSELESVNWPSSSDPHIETTRYHAFLSTLSLLPLDSTIDLLTKRYRDIETHAKKYQKDSRLYRDRTHRLSLEASDKIAYRAFKEGDLALFLPTRNQATRPWAAFNVGAPHYFLRETEAHRLPSREWLLARIHKVEERVVDLSRALQSDATSQLRPGDRRSLHTEASDNVSIDDENPFELSDGLRWYLIDAVEERAGAPPLSTNTPPGLGKSKSTVAASNVEVSGSFGLSKEAMAKNHRRSGSGEAVAKTLSRSLDSRRSSEASTSKKAPVAAQGPARENSALAVTDIAAGGGGGNQVEVVVVAPAESDIQPGQPGLPGPSQGPGQGPAREDARVFDVDGGRQSPAQPSPAKKPAAKKGFERIWGVEYSHESSSSTTGPRS